MRFKDQLDRVFHLTQTPKRIISLVPSQTELLVDLGVKNNLVGITKFCVHPASLRKEKTIVGGTKSVHFDKIEALHPDFIICNKEENTEEMVLHLQEIAPTYVSVIETIEDSLQMIKQLGEVLNVSKKASEIIVIIEKERHEFLKFIQHKPKQKVAYLIWQNPFMAVGRNTFIDSLLQLNNFDNIFSEKKSRYPEISMEELKGADVILLSSEPFPFKKEHCNKLSKETGKTVKLVDGEYFSWYGSRIKKAFRYFETLH